MAARSSGAGGNLIIIVADTLRGFRFIPDFGTGSTPAPFLDGVAKTAVLGPEMIASSPWTLPSHASLLTGIDPWDVRYDPVTGRHLIPRAESLATQWREMGGSSAAFSANPMVTRANSLLDGFDEVVETGAFSWATSLVLHQIQAVSFQLRGSGRWTPLNHKITGVLNHGTLSRLAFEATYLIQQANSTHSRSASRLVSRARRVLSASTTDRRRLLFFNLMETHEPYLPTPSARRVDSGAGCIPTSSMSAYSNELLHRPDLTSMLPGQYAVAVRALDGKLSSLFLLLKQEGLLENATVIFTSDHGQALGEGGFFGHGHFLHDPLVRVPLLVWRFKEANAVAEARHVEPIDHRHLHDLAVAAIHGDATQDIADILSRSILKRGPATSFWEGPSAFQKPGVAQRRVRIVTGSATAQGEVDLLRKSGLAVPDPSSIRFSEPPTALHERVRRLLLADHGAELNSSSEGSQDVEKRLSAWGYN
jgi:Sulfatase